jgi:hypothetical protein
MEAKYKVMIFKWNLAQFQSDSFKPVENMLLMVFRLFLVMGHFDLFANPDKFINIQTKTCIVNDSRFCPFSSKIPFFIKII